MTLRRLVVAFLTVVLTVTACGNHRKPSASVASTGPQGSVVGRIHGCSGIGYAKLQYVGGTIVVLRGEIRSMRARPGEGKTVFPTRVAAGQKVATSGHFHFTLHRGRM
jgi:hypothetical protein